MSVQDAPGPGMASTRPGFARGLLVRNEVLVALVIAAFCLVAALSDPRFLSLPTLTDLLRASIVTTIFAVGAMLVLVSGGIDVSFTAVAAFTMYVTAMLLNAAMPWMPWWGALMLGAGIGAALGAINAVLIAGLGLPTLIVTLRHAVDLPRLHADLRGIEADHHPAAGDARVRAHDDAARHQRGRQLLLAPRRVPHHRRGVGADLVRS